MIRDITSRIESTTASLRRIEYMMRANVRRLSAKPGDKPVNCMHDECINEYEDYDNADT
jgi:hypothetical protein